MQLVSRILILFLISMHAWAEDVPHTVDDDGNYYYPPLDDNSSAVQYEKVPVQKIEPTEDQKKRGVTRITENGEHFYGYKKGQTDHTVTFRIGSMDAPTIKNPDGFNFDEIYDEKFGFIQFSYEWKKNSRAGVFGVELGGGIASTTGSGRFANGDEALESYTFYTLPVHLGVNYRFQYSETQRLVPFVTGAIGYFGAVEARDDNKRNKLDSGAVALAGGGVMISLAGLDSVESAELEDSFGLKDLWISIEYRRMAGLDKNLDYSGNMINLGIILDL